MKDLPTIFVLFPIELVSPSKMLSRSEGTNCFVPFATELEKDEFSSINILVERSDVATG